MQRRILIAEDSPTQAERVRLILEDASYMVEVVSDGREGLRRVNEKPPDLIISDVMMPEMDGYTFCRAIKSNETTKRIPFVLLTDRKSPLDIIKGLERGADNFITKPFEDDIFLERIHRIFVHLEHRKTASMEMEVSIRVGRREIIVSPDKQQIIELLFSTFEDLSRTNKQLEESQRAVEDYARNLEERVDERTKAVQQSEARYRSLVFATAQIVWHMDRRGQVSEPLPSWQEYTGQNFEEIRGSGWAKTLHPDDVERTLKAWRHAVETETFYEGEYRIRRHDGVYRDFVVRGVPVLEDGGSVREWVGTCADITELKQLEEQFRQAQKMEAIGQLTGGIAHDFNNLLTVINGYSELTLQGLKADDPLRPNLEQVKEAGERAAALTRQLLAFSRKQVLEPRVLDLNAVVTNIDKMLTRMIGEDIDLVATLLPELGRVKADPGQVEQVIMNLAVNARDAMPQGGKLTIETADVELDDTYVRMHVGAKPGRHVMLAVSDTGCGMDAETQKRVFEPFFTTKEKGKGTGLGLATVYGIVKQSGGSIWVYSEVGKGTTFKVYLPRVEEQPDAVLPGTVRAASLKGLETILLIEDDEPLRKLALSILRHGGYHVLEASDREKAIQICGQHQGPIHLMLTDVVMPGISGQEVAQRLAATRPDMKALFMSGYTDDTVIRHGVLNQNMAFLQKPFTTHGLLRKVREVLDASQDLG